MKHPTLLFTIPLALALCAGAQEPPPPNLTTYMWPWSTNCNFFRVRAPHMGPCQDLDGIWVVSYLSDPTADALVITLTYDKGSEKNLTATNIAPKWYGIVNSLFVVGKVEVKSISLTPVKIVGEPKVVTP